MEKISAQIEKYLAAMVCVLIGGYLAFFGIAGWGWFLFVGVIVAGS